MDAQRLDMTTRDGVRVIRTAVPFDPAELGRIAALADERRGGVMSSGMEYPGRYSRWHMAYADPCLEIVATGRRVTVRALNDRGRVLLPVVRAALRRAGPLIRPDGEDSVVVPEDDREFTEEERSRRPTVFTALREIIAALGCDDPHLGLYGAFGYDLAFQFEPVRRRLDRPATQRDLVLHLPDEIWILDRKREEAVRYSYDFEVDGVSTAGLSRETAGTGGERDTRPVRDQDLPAQPLPGRYAQVVEDARERFARGDLFEVVPSHVFYGRCASPAAFYELLRQRNPAPYEFLFNLGEGEYLVGASPEMYVRVTGDRVETCPIAGTIARGEDTLEDAANIATLLGSAKEESELTMCTDVDRNDKARVCVPGTIKVLARRQIETVGARYVVLDSLTSMSLGVPSQRRFRELVYALTKHFRAAGVTPLMTMEVAELLGTAQLTGHGVSSIADNLILLRYVEVDGRLERAVSVLKARGTGHIMELRRFLIDGRGAHVGARFEDLRGVLTGIPQPARVAGYPVSRRSSGKKSRER